MCPFLLASQVVEGATTNNRAASRQTRSKSAQVWSTGLIREGVSGIQSAVLDKHEGVPMKSVHATLGDDVYGAARASARFCRETVIDHLKLLHGLRRQFRACRASELIVVLDAIDVEAVAARAQTREGEPAVGKGALAARGSLNIRPS